MAKKHNVDFNIQEIEVSKLKPAAYNPRRISKDALEALEKSIEMFGLVQPIVWNKRTGNIVIGHQRFKVLMKNKPKKLKVIVINLDEKREKALNVASNSPLLQGSFDKTLDNLIIDLNEFSHNSAMDLRLNELPQINWDEINKMCGEKIEEQKEKEKEKRETELTQFWLLVETKDELETNELFERLESEGYKCKIGQM